MVLGNIEMQECFLRPPIPEFQHPVTPLKPEQEALDVFRALHVFGLQVHESKQPDLGPVLR